MWMLILNDIQCNVGPIAYMSIDSSCVTGALWGISSLWSCSYSCLLNQNQKELYLNETCCQAGWLILMGRVEISLSLGDALLEQSIKICGHHCVNVTAKHIWG